MLTNNLSISNCHSLTIFKQVMNSSRARHFLCTTLNNSLNFHASIERHGKVAFKAA